MINVTIIGNTAINGGGISFSSYSDPCFVNTTIAGNTASVYGGGIYCGNRNSNLCFINTIVWGNSPSEVYSSNQESSNSIYPENRFL